MIRWGILGLGNIARRFSTSLSHSRNGFLYAVGSRSMDKGLAYQKEFGCKAYGSYDELLADENVDAVYIALPHGLHRTWTIRSLEAHKAVLCEKPCGLNEEEVQQMLAVADREQMFFMEAMKARFIPIRAALKRDLESGVIGDLVHVYADFCSNSDVLHRDCYLYERKQGGVLLDVGPYPISFFMDLLDGMPESYDCLRIVDQNDVEHHLEGTLTWKNGVTTEFALSCMEARERQAVLTGTKGRIVVPFYYRADHYVIESEDGTSIKKEVPLPFDDMSGEIEEVHRCLEKGLLESPYFSGSESLRCACILEEIRRKTYTAGTIVY